MLPGSHFSSFLDLKKKKSVCTSLESESSAAHNSLAASAGGGVNAGQWDLADTPPCVVKGGSGQEEKSSPANLASWL